jgi:hypothetical protein
LPHAVALPHDVVDVWLAQWLSMLDDAEEQSPQLLQSYV